MNTDMQGIINIFAHGMWSIVLPLAIAGILIGSGVGLVFFFLRTRMKRYIRNSKKRYR